MTSVLLGLPAVLSLGAALTNFNRARVVDDYLNGRATLFDIRDADGLVNSLVGFLFIMVVPVGIVFIIWQYRHSKNAEALRGTRGLGPGWAIGGWFIPVANFVLPFIELYQSAKASSPTPPPGAAYHHGAAPKLLTAWAVTFIAAPVTFVTASGLRSDPDVAFVVDSVPGDKLIDADRIGGIAMLLYTAAAMLAIVMVGVLTRRQDRAVAFAAGPAPSPLGPQWCCPFGRPLGHR